MNSMGASSSGTRKPFSDRTNTFESLNASQSSSTSTRNSSSIIKRSELISGDAGRTSVAAKPSRTQAVGATRSGKGKGDDKLTESCDVLVSSVFTTLKSSVREGTASVTIKQGNLISANASKNSVATRPTKTQADQATGSRPTAKVKDGRKLTEPGGKGDGKPTEPGDVFVPPVSTPSRTLNPSFLEGNDRPSPVYVQRQSAIKIMSKEKEIDVPKSCSPAMRSRSKRDKLNEGGVSSLSKSCPPPQRKKQRRTTPKEDVAIHALPQDVIEQQKAYFAEVDAFELSEEEVDELSED